MPCRLPGHIITSVQQRHTPHLKHTSSMLYAIAAAGLSPTQSVCDGGCGCDSTSEARRASGLASRIKHAARPAEASAAASARCLPTARGCGSAGGGATPTLGQATGRAAPADAWVVVLGAGRVGAAVEPGAAAAAFPLAGEVGLGVGVEAAAHNLGGCREEEGWPPLLASGAVGVAAGT